MSNNPPPAKNRRETVVTVFFWLGIGLMLVLPFWLFLDQFRSAQRQYRINHTYVPVEATVLSAQVTSFKGSKGAVHYVPEVQYQYEVEGKTYRSEQLAALSASGDEAWAKAIIKRYPIRQPCRAFHDPQDPSQAILIRGYVFEPYFGMLEMAFVLAGGSFFVLQMRFMRKREPAPSGNGWFEIKPEFGERQRLIIARVCTGVWYGFGAVPAAHYFLCVPPPHATRSVNCFIGFALLGLIPLGLMIRYLLMNRNLDEARLLLDQPVAFVGRRFRFAISQCARRQLQVKDVRVRLLCIGTKAQGRSRVRRTLYEATPVELKDHTLHAGESLELSGELTPPSNQRPTGRDASGEFDRIDWKIRLDCNVVHAPDYEADFPVAVQIPPAEEPATGERPRAFVEVRPIDSQFAGRILTKRNIAMVYLIGLLPLLVVLLGLGMMAVGYPVIFPGDTEFPRLFDASKTQAKVLFAGGGVLALAGIICGLTIPSLLANRYIYYVAKKTVSRRLDAIVIPDTDSVFVEIIPRTNWNRLMLENATDIGFLTVDVRGREVRFEGDKERYRVPADALRSCELEKSFYSGTARPNAPGIWLAVIRACGPAGVWEAPVAPRLLKGRSISKAQERTAKELQARIKTLLPATQTFQKQES